MEDRGGGIPGIPAHHISSALLMMLKIRSTAVKVTSSLRINLNILHGLCRFPKLKVTVKSLKCKARDRETQSLEQGDIYAHVMEQFVWRIEV